MKTKAFFRAFLLTLFIIVPVYAGIIIWQYRTPQQVTGAASQVEINKPGAEDFKTLLVISESESGCSFVLIRMDALQNKFTVSALPAQSVVLAAGEAKTLESALAYAGPAYVSSALAQTIELRIDHYFYGESASMAKLISKLASVQVTLLSDIVANAPAGYEIYRRSAGTALANAQELTNIFKYGEFEAGERTALVQQVYASILQKNLPDLAATLPTAYRNSSSLFTTDMLAQDVYRYERILGFLARQEPTIVTQSMPGEWNEDRFELSARSLEFAQENFG